MQQLADNLNFKASVFSYKLYTLHVHICGGFTTEIDIDFAYLNMMITDSVELNTASHEEILQ